MSELKGYHPYCHKCYGNNAEPKYKMCPACRAYDQRRKARWRDKNNIQKKKTNPCGLAYTEVVNAAGPTDALPGGLRYRPGHKPGWVELM